MTVISKDKITDENVQDIVDTAAYGGITYWASEPSQADFDAAPEGTVATIYDSETDEPEGAVHHLTADNIRQAVVDIVEKGLTNSTIRDYITGAFDEWNSEDGIDCGYIDADAADCIVQVACFGKVVYG